MVNSLIVRRISEDHHLPENDYKGGKSSSCEDGHLKRRHYCKNIVISDDLILQLCDNDLTHMVNSD